MPKTASIPLTAVPNTACKAAYEVRYRAAGEAAFITLPDQVESPIRIAGLKEGVSYEAEIRMRCCDQSISEPTTVAFTVPD